MSAPRCGDHVTHGPSGEQWLVAWCEGNDLAWCGWPNGMARTADCEITQRATDAEHRNLVDAIVRLWPSVQSERVKRLYPDALT